MIGPIIGTRTCSLCDAAYESDTKLSEHQRMAHRGRGNVESPDETIIERPEDSET